MKNVLGILLLVLLVTSCGEEKDCCDIPPTTTYSFAKATAQGCASFYVYKELPEEKLHLYISGNRAELELNSTEQSFGIDAPNLKVEMHKFKDEIGNYACDDVANDQGEIISTWTAISGEVTLQITEDSISVDPWGTTFKMTAKLKNMELENAEKDLISIPDEVFEEVFVGWLPG